MLDTQKIQLKLFLNLGYILYLHNVHAQGRQANILKKWTVM